MSLKSYCQGVATIGLRTPFSGCRIDRCFSSYWHQGRHEHGQLSDWSCTFPSLLGCTVPPWCMKRTKMSQELRKYSMEVLTGPLSTFSQPKADSPLPTHSGHYISITGQTSARIHATTKPGHIGAACGAASGMHRVTNGPASKFALRRSGSGFFLCFVLNWRYDTKSFPD